MENQRSEARVPNFHIDMVFFVKYVINSLGYVPRSILGFEVHLGQGHTWV